MGGMMGLPPQIQQALMAQLAQQKAPGAPAPPTMGAPTPPPVQMTPQPGQGQQPPAPQGNLPLPALGGNNAMLAGGTAIPQVRGVPMTAQPQRPPQRTSASGIAAIPMAAYQIKQKMHNDKVQKTRAAVNEWIAMQDNPDAQKELQKAAQQDPKIAKILQKKQQDFAKLSEKAMKDPNSAEAQGIQMAYRDQQGKEQQDIATQEAKSKMQQQQAITEHNRALAIQEQARARNIDKKTDQSGEVTDKDKFQADQKMRLVQYKVQGDLQKAGLAVTALQQRAQQKIDSLERIAKMHEAGADSRAAMRESGANKRAGMRSQQNYALTAMTKEYGNIKSEIANLDKEQKSAMDDLIKNPISSWATGQDDAFQSRSAAIDGQRRELEARLGALDASVNAMSQGGVIPRDPGPGTIPTVTKTGSGVTVHDFTGGTTK